MTTFDAKPSLNVPSYKIRTWTQGEAVYQEIESPDKEIRRQVFDTAERLVRARLIELGWAPPKETNDEH